MLGHTEGSGALDSPGLTRFTAGVELHHLFMLVLPASIILPSPTHRSSLLEIPDRIFPLIVP
jgi:hypothetical protein